jgi:ABC-type lipoprotein release transport system permease subunit
MSSSSLFSHLRRGFGENVRFALLAVRAHKLRASLTVLGIVIGVATVIAMVSIVEGFNNNIVRSFQSLAPPSCIFRSGRTGFSAATSMRSRLGARN